MSKKTCLISVSFMILLCGCLFEKIEPFKQKPLLKNGSFEKIDSNGKLLDWRAPYGGYELADKPVHSGSKSLFLTTEGKSIKFPKESRFGVCQTIKVAPGSNGKLKISSWIYVEEFKSGIIKPVHLSFRSAGKTFFSHINILPGDEVKNQWKKYTFVLDLSKYPDTEQICIWCLTWSHGKKPFNGTVYFDDIELEI